MNVKMFGKQSWRSPYLQFLQQAAITVACGRIVKNIFDFYENREKCWLIIIENAGTERKWSPMNKRL